MNTSMAGLLQTFRRSAHTLAQRGAAFRLPESLRSEAPLLRDLQVKPRIQAAVLDFSGTTVDAYVIAPAIAFVKAFAEHGIAITMEEARGPMGLHKHRHIEALLRLDSVMKKWSEVHGHQPTQKDADQIFSDFVPLQLACLDQYSAVIPGVVDAVNLMRQDKVKIGATTGFVSSMVDVLVSAAKKQGLEFDCTVAGDEVQHGTRPSPHMLYRNMDLLGVHNPRFLVKVDDTISGVGEGLHAGCWTVGVTDYSNYMNINSLQQAANMSSAELTYRRDISRQALLASGAHYVIRSLHSLPAVIDNINQRLAQGEIPGTLPQPPLDGHVSELQRLGPR